MDELSKYLQKLLESFEKGETATLKVDGVEQNIAPEQIEGLLAEVATSDWGQERFATMARDQNLGKIATIAGQIAQTAGQFGDLATSKEQIEAAKSALQRIKEPQMPAVEGIDPALDQEIQQAQLGTLDSANLGAAARSGFDESYRRDLARAQSASGGQAGAYGALSQLASGRRNQAEIGLTPQLDAVRRGEEARLQGLLRDRESGVQNRMNTRMNQYRLANSNYERDSRAVGQQMQDGRFNRRQSMRNLGSIIGASPNMLKSNYLPSNLASLFSRDSDPEDIINNINTYDENLSKNMGLASPYGSDYMMG